MPGGSGESPCAVGKIVVIIDDDPAVLMALVMLLESWGLTPVQADSMDGLSEELDRLPAPPALVVADYFLPGGTTGKDAVDLLRTRYGTEMPAIILTGDTSPMRVAEAATHGFRLLLKPVHPEHLQQAVQDLL